MLPLEGLRTTDGRPVEVVDPGLYNRSDAGPDFFNAKVKIDGLLWIGNVEMHVQASDWYRHRHDSDPAYDNIVLHVVMKDDMEVTTSQGKVLVTAELPVPPQLKADYEELLYADEFPPCYKMIPSMPGLKVHSWLSALQTERLERKTTDVMERVKQLGDSWEDAYFVTLARNFGFGINGDIFETWAKTLPLSAAAHHRDDLFQIETLFIGYSGLLDKVEEKYAREWAYLSKKFSLTPMDASQWKYLRMRPQNFPHVRLLQLARMYHENRTGISALLECKTVAEVGSLYNVSGSKLGLFVINTAAPAIFAYGRQHGKEELCERAFDMLESIKPEDNKVIRMWRECGIEVRSAGDTQALLQLKNEYCDHKECLRCRFGYEFLRGEYRQAFLHDSIEPEETP